MGTQRLVRLPTARLSLNKANRSRALSVAGLPACSPSRLGGETTRATTGVKGEVIHMAPKRERQEETESPTESPNRLSDPAWMERLKLVPVWQRLIAGGGAGAIFMVLTGLIGGWAGWVAGAAAAGAFGWGTLSWLAARIGVRGSPVPATVAGVVGGALAGVAVFTAVHSVAWLRAEGWPLDLEGDRADPWTLLLAGMVGGWALFGGVIGATTGGKRSLAEKAALAAGGGIGGAFAGGTICFVIYAVAWVSQRGWQLPS
jgi:hypothetical protein